MKTNDFSIKVSGTAAVCPVGETTGSRNIACGAIPVLSCEGACIRGELARLAANQVARLPGFARGCHGELFAAPDSQMAQWVRQAPQVVLIDGCHLHCHGRILENLVGKDRIRVFNAQSHHRKYGEFFEIEGVPEAERREVARDLADWVARQLEEPSAARSATRDSCCD